MWLGKSEIVSIFEKVPLIILRAKFGVAQECKKFCSKNCQGNLFHDLKLFQALAKRGQTSKHCIVW